MCREVLIHSRECQAAGGQGAPGWHAAFFQVFGRAAFALLMLALVGATGYLGARAVAGRASAAIERYRERHQVGRPTREVRCVCLPWLSCPARRSADACPGRRCCQDATRLLWLEEEAGCRTSSFIDEYTELEGETGHDALALRAPASGVAPPAAEPAPVAVDSELPGPRADPLADLDPFK